MNVLSALYRKAAELNQIQKGSHRNEQIHPEGRYREVASLTGSSIASATLLAKMLVPKMLERKYSPLLAIGPSFAAGGLALIVPPSGVIIILGAVTGISIGKLLIGGIIPGLILAGSYCLFSVTAAYFVPGQDQAGDVLCSPGCAAVP